MAKHPLQHIILRQIFDIEIPTEKEGREFQSKISRFANQVLPKLLDEIFEEISNPNEIIRINSIDLDLGYIDPYFLEIELKEKIRTALQKAIKDRIAYKQYTTTPTDLNLIPQKESELDILIHFFKTGRLSSLGAKKGASIQTVLDNLLSKNPAQLKQTLQTHSRDVKLPIRLAQQFHPSSILALIELLLGQQAAFFKKYTRQLWSKHREITSDSIGFQRTTLEIALAYIFKTIAAHRVFSKPEYQQKLQNELSKRYPIIRRNNIFETLNSTNKDNILVSNSTAKKLQLFLSQGVFTSDDPTKNIKDFVQDIITQKPTLFLDVLQEEGYKSAIKDRILQQFSATTIYAIFDVLNQKNADFVRVWIHNLKLMQNFINVDKALFNYQVHDWVLEYLLRKIVVKQVFDKTHFEQTLIQKVAKNYDLNIAQVKRVLEEQSSKTPIVKLEEQSSKKAIEKLEEQSNKKAIEKIDEKTTRTYSLLEKLEYFLKYGFLQDSEDSIETIWSTLIETNVEGIVKIPYKYAEREAVFLRLNQLITEKKWGRLLTYWTPTYATFFEEQTSKLAAKYAGFDASENTFQKYIQLLVLRYVLQEIREGQLDREDFFEYIATFLKKDYSKEQKEGLIEQITHELLTNEIVEPSKEKELKEAKTLIFTAPSLVENTESYELLHRFLVSGKLPNRLKELWRRQLDENPKVIVALLKTIGNSALVQERMMQHLPNELIQKTWSILSPTEAGFVNAAYQYFKIVHREAPLVRLSSLEFDDFLVGNITKYLLSIQQGVFIRADFTAFLLKNMAKTVGENQQKSKSTYVRLVGLLHTLILKKHLPVPTLRDFGKILKKTFDNRLETDKVSFERLEKEDSVEMLLDALFYSIENGEQAWWNDKNIKTLLNGLATKYPEKMKLRFERKIFRPIELERFHKALSLELSEQVLIAILPNFSGLILTTILAFESVVEHSNFKHWYRSISSPKQFIWKRVWQIILTKKVSDFQVKSFIVQLLLSLSEAVQNSPRAIQAHFQVVVQEKIEQSVFRFFPLENILQELTNFNTEPTIVNQEKEITYPSDIEQVIYFLEHGSLQRTQYTRFSDFMEVLNRLLQEEQAILRPVLLKLVKVERIRKRWSRQLPLAILAIFVQIMMPKIGQQILACLQILERHLDSRFLYKMVFDFIVKIGDSATLDPFLKFLIQTLGQLFHGDFRKAYDLLKKAFKEYPVLWKTIADIFEDLSLLPNQKTTTKKSKSQDFQQVKEEKIEDPIFINNSGMVILYPFMIRYFETLGLMINEAFKDKEAALRGVHLLQYMVSGMNETPENELVLNKLLVGIPISEPVPAGIELTEKEKDLSELVLRSVLGQWAIMQSDSIRHLRGNFLLRGGRLLQEEARWVLRVEQKPYDLLLDSLPWGFSILNLPWMQTSVFVEWA